MKHHDQKVNKVLKKVYELSKRTEDEKSIVEYIKSVGCLTLMELQFAVESEVGGVKDVFDSSVILSRNFNFEYVLSRIDKKANIIYLKEFGGDV